MKWMRRWRMWLRNLKDSSFVKMVYQILFFLVGKLPVKQNLVIFESFNGKQFSCNPRAIYEYMKENCPEYKLIWCVNKSYLDAFNDKDITFLQRFSLRWLLTMPRARYWIINSRMPLWIPKPNHTTYVQTWHGTPLKKLAIDIDEVHIPGTTSRKYKEEFAKEANRWDYLISPNQYSSDIFRRAFDFHHELIESGYPRNDYLYRNNNQENISEIKQANGLPLNKKVILYAPTWRDDQFYTQGRYKFSLELDLKAMKEKLGDEYIVVLRMHYLVAENLDLSEYRGFAYDYSKYEDIRDLYLIADLLVTDYSSVFFDYANLKRPMIFFVYDIENYRDKLRGFYIDFEKEAPGPLLKTSNQVIESIQNIKKVSEEYQDKFTSFYSKFCSWEDGSASERVINQVLKD